MIDAEKLRGLRTLFAGYEDIVCVYLFGSYVRDAVRSGSDLDFAVLTKGPFEDTARLAYEIEKALDFLAPVDLVVLSRQKVMFQHTVLREGKIVYEGDQEARVRFEMGVMRRFAELEPHLRFMERYRTKGLLRRLGYEHA